MQTEQQNKIRVIALKPLVGDYGSVQEEQEFEALQDQADELEARGLVRRAIKIMPTNYENKMAAATKAKRR